LYYGGTAYDNRAGLGEQWTMGTETLEPYAIAADQPALNGDMPDGSLHIVMTPALYTAGTLINHTKLLEGRIARPTLFLNAADAAQLAIADEDVVAVIVNGVDVAAVAHVNGTAPEGVALLSGVASHYAGHSGPAVRLADSG
jgi:anaerobic selenocysteine-containing dehydrogenase